MLSIILPVRYLSKQIFYSLISSQVALVDNTLIYLGIQDFKKSDPNLLDFLSEISEIIIVDSSHCTNLSCNLNNIIRQVNTKFAVRMDGDDLMHPKRLCYLLKYLSQDNPAIVAQAYMPIRANKKFQIITPFYDSTLNKLQLLLGVPFAHPSITINLELINSDPYNQNYMYAQDYHLYVDFLYSGSYVGLPSKGIYYDISESLNPSSPIKRKLQLQSHEAAMYKLWKSIDKLSFTVTTELIHLIRSNLVTDEFSNCLIDEDSKNFCIDCMKQATDSLTKMIARTY